MADQQQSFLARLKQHHLYGVVVAYAVVAAFLIQLVSRVFPYFGWAGAVPAVIVVLLLGFPVVVVLAWLFIKPKDQMESDTWQRRHWKLSTAVTLAVIVLVVISGFYGLRYSKHYAAHLEATATSTVAKPTLTTGVAPSAATVVPAKSIAVLPFENLSDDKKNEYFVAGMQDLILTKLADIGDLKVISRTSTAQYASHPESLKQIGEQLGVATILEGSVQKAGDQVLINVQLIDARTDNHIWAQAYQRTLDNVFGVEGEVAQNVADSLKARLSPAESAALADVPTTNQAAYNLFLHAEYQANKGDLNSDTASMKAAIHLYRQAVEQDPNFALAFARLSYTESALAWFGGGGEDVKQLNQQARVDAERALQLQPDLAAAYLAIGFTEYWGREDYPAALKAFAAALKLKPNYFGALVAQGVVERRQGHFDAAIATFQQALTLDPRNSELADGLGQTYMSVSRYTDAEDAFQRALALNPDNRLAQTDYSTAILFSTGDIPRALAAVQGDDPSLKLTRAYLLTFQRKYREALALLDSIPDTPDNFRAVGGSKAARQADLYRLMGDEARARALYAQDLSAARAQVNVQQAHNLAALWGGSIAHDEFGLGHTAEGLDAQAKAQAIVDKSPDQFIKPLAAISQAQLRARAGLADQAIPLLVKALAMPGIGAYYSSVLLWLDPSWDPIRNDPRFQALLKKHAKYKPAVTYPAPSAST